MSTGIQTLLLVVTGLIVAFRTWGLVRMLWSLPLAHGQGLFLGVEVGPGFYEGAGIRWLWRYRALMLTEYLIGVTVLIAVALWGRWDLLPVCAVGGSVLFVFAFVGFAFWARAKLGGTVPSATRLAVPLEIRRLRHYISWRAESLAGALVAASWVLLLTQGTHLDRPKPPLVLTYLLVGCAIAKIGCVRMGFALPAERTEEHHRWFDAHRRHSLLVFDSAGWVFAVALTGYAVLHRWPAVREIPWLFWGIIALIMGISVLMTVRVMYWAGRLAAAGRDLRPPAIRPSSLPSIRWLRNRSLWLTVGYVAGFFLLLRVLPS